MRNVSMFGWALIFCACVIPGFASSHEHEHEEQSKPAPQTESLFNITDNWTTSNGQEFHLDALGGNPSVIAMIYSSCKDVFPLIVEDMKKIERHLPSAQAGKVHFAVFSFDPARPEC